MPIHPDDVLGRYLELREKLGAATSQQLVAERGLIFDEQCPKCRRRDTREERRARKGGATTFVCGHCSHSWPVEVGFLLRNQFKGGPRRQHDAALVEMTSLGNMLARLSLQEKRVYLVLFCFEEIGSFAEIAAEAARRWPRMKPERLQCRTQRLPEWTEWTARRTVERARARIRRTLTHRAEMDKARARP